MAAAAITCGRNEALFHLKKGSFAKTKSSARDPRLRLSPSARVVFSRKAFLNYGRFSCMNSRRYRERRFRVFSFTHTGDIGLRATCSHVSEIVPVCSEEHGAATLQRWTTQNPPFFNVLYIDKLMICASEYSWTDSQRLCRRKATLANHSCE